MKSKILSLSFVLVAAILFASCGTIPARAAKDSRPNIIYIMADDLGYGDLGCYGQKLIKTPSIDALAKEGMKFTQHYAGSNVCAPSRCVLMTGLHTGNCYIRNNRPLPVEGNVPLPEETQTVAKLMKKAGYITGAMGKWGLGYPGSSGDPNNQGFDHFFGYNCQRQAHSYYPSHLWRNDKKVPLDGKTYSHDLLTEEALGFIRTNKDKPFFLYIPYTIPHTKFQVPELGQYADAPWSEQQKVQAAMISRMDADVGRIMELLKELDLDEKTLVIFTSDNGPHGGGGTLERFKASGPLRGKKGGMYEGGIRVPMVARWPGKIKPGSISHHMSAFQDVLPTCAELAGAKVERPVDGISMVPALLGRGTQSLHKYLYWERAGTCAVRFGPWKAVGKIGGEGPVSLYNLEKDLAEITNIAGDNPKVVAEMKQIMKAAHQPTPFDTWQYTGPGADKKPKQRPRRRGKGK